MNQWKKECKTCPDADDEGANAMKGLEGQDLVADYKVTSHQAKSADNHSRRDGWICTRRIKGILLHLVDLPLGLANAPA